MCRFHQHPRSPVAAFSVTAQYQTDTHKQITEPMFTQFHVDNWGKQAASSRRSTMIGGLTTTSRILLVCAFLVLLIVGSAPVTVTALEDLNDGCSQWAASGECDNNPGYMLSNCAKSCDDMAQQVLNDSKELEGIQSFFDLHANDLHGKTLDFRQFQGQVTLVVNVASECGYTDSHYKSLVKLYKQINNQKTTSATPNINIVAFPCNQFGRQEPGTADEILTFVEEEYGVEFIMMEKVDVNGPTASIVYKYLKSKAGGPATIAWNFATYFVVGPDGTTVESYSGIEPLELQDQLFALAKSGDEL